MIPNKNNLKWKLKEHSKAKHEILEKYLSRWFPILGKWNNKIYYIDGFAGRGRYLYGEDGSPLIAIKTAIPYCFMFPKTKFIFYFLEKDRSSFSNLCSEVEQIRKPANLELHLIQEKFNEIFPAILNDLEANKLKPIPDFAFVDPYGLTGISFDTISKLLTYQKTELFINIMTSYIQRFTKDLSEQIGDVIGSDNAPEIISNTSTNKTNKARELYKTQLLTVARYVKWFQIKKKTNQRIYDLFFATNNLKGFKIIKEVFWEIDPQSGYSYSGNYHLQNSLFKGKHTEEVAKIIQQNFLGQEVEGSTVFSFINEHPDFIESQAKDALLYLETEQLVNVCALKSDKTKRRKGSFPDEVILKFKPF